MRYPIRTFLTCLVSLLLLASSAAAQESEGDTGIAASYPGDVGIAADPDVVFVESFEGSLGDIMGRWDDVKEAGLMSVTGDVPAASSGTQSLLMHKTPGDGTTGAGLYNRVLGGGNGYTQLYARMYVKIAAGADWIHHFGTNLGGLNPPSPWPIVNAGSRTDGDVSFWTGIEPYGDSWRWDFYTYWMEMRSFENPDGTGSSAWGNAFLRDTADGSWAPIGPAVRRGEWVSMELMVKVNAIGETDGEQAFWIDGQLIRDGGQIISHLGPGFPNGTWLRDKWSPDPGGAPFEGYRWRSAADLLVNYVWLYVYTEEDTFDISAWYDDVVVATSYIGPLYSGPAMPRPDGGVEPDAGAPDSAVAWDDVGPGIDAGSRRDGGGRDGGGGAGEDGGCCSTAGTRDAEAPLGLLVFMGALVVFRRRQRLRR